MDRPLRPRRSVPTGGSPQPLPRRRARRLLLVGLTAVLAGAVAIQFVSYPRPERNPPVLADASWPDGQARALARQACYDCHSNETSWPLYSRVAPSSWLVARDVAEGRKKLNFSEWGLGDAEAEEASETVLDGSMPPRSYQLLHPGARIDDEQRRLLADALEAMAPGTSAAARRYQAASSLSPSGVTSRSTVTSGVARRAVRYR